jgi:hypothetical protein
MKTLWRVACIALVSFALAGCGPRPDASYRYKLTISVDTPEGMKVGSNVVELDYFKSWGGEPHRTYGQALVLGLGAPGTLVALLTQEKREAWEDNDPKYMILKKCGGDERTILGPIDVARRIVACRAVYPVDLSDLPDILLLKNAKDPVSAAAVDPQHPEVVLGLGVVVRSAAIQLTDEPLTPSVDDHLPWVRSWWGRIDSPILRDTHYGKGFVGHLDFIQEGEG